MHCNNYIMPLHNVYLMMLVLHSNITFQLVYPNRTETNRTETIDKLDEGVEFSLQFGSERGWIPITFVILSDKRSKSDFIPIGTYNTGESSVLIRGYSSELKEISPNENAQHSVTVCDFEDSEYSVQFRWLQTCRCIQMGVRDAWNLENVLITYQDRENGTFVLFDGSK